MDYQQLIINADGSITAEQKQFVELHKEIVYCGNAAAEFAIKGAEKLKEMRDKKLYTAAGFETFGDYAEAALGVKERHAYNFIKVYEELPENFLQSNAKLGITKLTLLASLSDSQRAEVVESTDIESITVKELKEQLKALESKNEQLEIQLDAHTPMYNDEFKSLSEESVKSAKEVEKLTKEKTKLEKEIESLKNQPKEIETVENPETAEKLAKAQADIESKEKELAAKRSEIENLNKQLTIAADAVMSKFKVKFEDLQRLFGEIRTLLNQLDTDKKAKCTAAVNAVLEGWKS